jgi:hypothetical protein
MIRRNPVSSCNTGLANLVVVGDRGSHERATAKSAKVRQFYRFDHVQRNGVGATVESVPVETVRESCHSVRNNPTSESKARFV